MGGKFNFSFAPILASNFKWESIASWLIPKSNRTARASFSDGYSCTGFESCWGLATRISTLSLSKRLTLTITSMGASPRLRGHNRG